MYSDDVTCLKWFYCKITPLSGLLCSKGKNEGRVRTTNNEWYNRVLKDIVLILSKIIKVKSFHLVKITTTFYADNKRNNIYTI
jgi:hypothetical protein